MSVIECVEAKGRFGKLEVSHQRIGDHDRTKARRTGRGDPVVAVLYHDRVVRGGSEELDRTKEHVRRRLRHTSDVVSADDVIEVVEQPHPLEVAVDPFVWRARADSEGYPASHRAIDQLPYSGKNRLAVGDLVLETTAIVNHPFVLQPPAEPPLQLAHPLVLPVGAEPGDPPLEVQFLAVRRPDVHHRLVGG